MKIGIIGAGMVGGALTKAFARRGHAVIVSASDPRSDKMKDLVAAAGSNARAGTAAEAAAHGEIIVLAAPWPATETLARSLDLKGKIVIDANNPIKPDFSGVEVFENSSAGEKVAEWAKGARVVKTLNQIGFALMDAPKVAAGTPVMFVAGDDDAAKKTVSGLVGSLGFNAVDCGALSMSRYLEALAWLWINRAVKQGKGSSFALVLSDAAPGA